MQHLARRSARPVMLWVLVATLLACDVSWRQAEPSRLETLEATPRPFRLRLSGDFPYATCEEPSRDPDRLIPQRCGPTPTAPLPDRSAQEAPPTRGATPDLEPTRQRAVARLVLRETERWRAVEMLEQAAAASPADAAVLVDLAVAIALHAEETEDPSQLVRALDVAEKAATMQPPLPAALFNRALLRTWLALQSEAVKAWNAYLEVDAASPWADEARQHLEHLQRPRLEQRWQDIESKLLDGELDLLDMLDVELFRQPLRELAEDRLLPRWGRYHQAGDEAIAASHLGLISRIGELLAPLGGQLLRAALVRIETCGADATCAELAAGHARYGDGVELLASRREESRTAFEAADEYLSRAGSPFALRARVHLMGLAYWNSAWGEVSRLGEGILERIPKGEFPSLRGRVEWIQGTAFHAQAQHSAALHRYRSALEALEHTQEVTSQIALRSLLGNLSEELGDFESAWQSRYRALTALQSHGNDRRLRLLLNSVVASALDHRWKRAAEVLQSEALAAAHRTGADLPLATIYRQRAALRQRLGWTEQALGDITTAERFASKIRDPADRAGVDAGLLLEKGRILRDSAPRQAQALLDGALVTFREHGFSHQVPPLLTERALCSVALENFEAAQNDLEQAVELIEQQRERLEEGSHRIAFLDGYQDPYHRLTQVQIRQGKLLEALETSERARARQLLDRLSSSSTAGAPDDLAGLLSTEDVLSRIPASTVIVSYKILAGEIVIWALDHSGLAKTSVVKKPANLAREVAALRTFIIDGSDRARPRLAIFFDLLIRPVLEALVGHERLVIVPDQHLASLPFAALLDRESGEHLIESHDLTLAPSLNTYIQLQSSPPLGIPQSVLIVANPSHDRKRHPGFVDLPGAEREGAEIAGLYPDSTVISGIDATESEVLKLLGQTEVVHFAGHAIANARNPFLSYLLLAPGRDTDDTLTAEELQNSDLGTSRLVVLSACKTVGESPSTSESVAGLIWPLLANGAVHVVASLWDVGDDAAVSLMTDFHRHLSSGRTPAGALREAQRSSLRANDPDEYHWSVFQIYGG